MELDANVWIKQGSDDTWVRAKVLEIRNGIKAKNGLIESIFTLQLQDNNGIVIPSKTVSITSTPTEESSSEFCHVKLRNLTDDTGSDRISDLTVLTHLHEPAIIRCLHARFESNMIYTSTGPILIAINPFQSLPIYSAGIVSQYRTHGENIHEGNSDQPLPPHVFKIADNAFRNMITSLNIQSESANQSILVSGESGAGKTETTKFIMQYLADITRDRTQIGTSTKRKSIEEQLLQSNPILESFGNARTLRNDNSSRFGKFIEINFVDIDHNMHLTISGATIRTYLLEKVRLVFQGPGERNYHCFYEIIRGSSADELTLRGLTLISDFQCLSQSGNDMRQDGVQDGAQYLLLKSAMNTLNFTDEDQNAILNIAVAVLHLGNLKFLSNSATTDTEGCHLDRSCQHNISFVCRLLDIEEKVLEASLCEKFVKAKDDSYLKLLSVAESDFGRDALAKAIYSALFDWLVMKVNNAISSDKQMHSLNTGSPGTPAIRFSNVSSAIAFIGVLDIFGFESFQINSFEQLCINYTNETLQQHFNQFVFKFEQQLYDREHINWSFISFPDNTETLDLLENKQTGIFSICDDQCRFQWSTHLSLVNKFYEKCGSHPQFAAASYEKARQLFIIKHYAGPVCYEAKNFLEKNHDVISADMVTLIKSSSSPLVRQLYEFFKVADPDDASDSKKRGPQTPGKQGSSRNQTLGGEFRKQLETLMVNINTTSPHYARCIKPNSKNKPKLFESPLVVGQLRCGGVLEAVRVSRAGFPNRFLLEDFVQRFASIAGLKVSTPYDASAQAIANRIANMIVNSCDFVRPVGVNGNNEQELAGIQKGVSMVFLRRPTFDWLERKRLQILRESVVKIQAYVRRFVRRKVYCRKLLKILVIQCRVRVWHAVMQVQLLRERRASIHMERAVRGYLARKLRKRLELAVLRLQCWRRTITSCRVVKCTRRNHRATRIEAFVRRYMCQNRYKRTRKMILWLQTCYRRHLARKVLFGLKQDAKNLQKVAAERDQLATQVAEWERKWKIMMAMNPQMALAFDGSSTVDDSSIERHDPPIAADATIDVIGISQPNIQCEQLAEISIQAVCVNDNNPELEATVEICSDKIEEVVHDEPIVVPVISPDVLSLQAQIALLTAQLLEARSIAAQPPVLTSPIVATIQTTSTHETNVNSNPILWELPQTVSDAPVAIDTTPVSSTDCDDKVMVSESHCTEETSHCTAGSDLEPSHHVIQSIEMNPRAVSTPIQISIEPANISEKVETAITNGLTYDTITQSAIPDSTDNWKSQSFELCEQLRDLPLSNSVSVTANLSTNVPADSSDRGILPEAISTGPAIEDDSSDDDRPIRRVEFSMLAARALQADSDDEVEEDSFNNTADAFDSQIGQNAIVFPAHHAQILTNDKGSTYNHDRNVEPSETHFEPIPATSEYLQSNEQAELITSSDNIYPPDKSSAQISYFGGHGSHSNSVAVGLSSGMLKTHADMHETSGLDNNSGRSRSSSFESSISRLTSGGGRFRTGDFDMRMNQRYGYLVGVDLKLHESVRHNDPEAVQDLLTAFPKMIRSADEAGRTALHIACKESLHEMTEILLQYNANVNAQDVTGKTGLHLCTSAGMIEMLCVEEASPNIVDNMGFTPLHAYVISAKADCVRTALKYGADAMICEPFHQRTSLHLAADLGDFDLISAILMESKTKLNLNAIDGDGNTALHLAAQCEAASGGQQKCCMLLLGRGSSALQSNERGISPLHYICANRFLANNLLSEPIVEVLLDMSADPNSQDADGCTPLTISCAYREWTICRMLLEAGGDMNVPCSMNSYLLQRGERYDEAAEMMCTVECTTSDLMPRGVRQDLFRSIRVLQSRIPPEHRDRCMNCAAAFSDVAATGSFRRRLGGGKNSCRHCGRIVCNDCAPSELPRSVMPDFVQEAYSESNMRVCKICCQVLGGSTPITPAAPENKRRSFWG